MSRQNFSPPAEVTPVEALRIKHRMEAVVALRDHGLLSRVELARRIGLSSTTLTKVVSDLIARGWIVESEARRAREVGRPQIGLALVPGACEVLVLVMEPDAVSLAAVGLDLQPQHLERHEMAFMEPQQAMKTVADLVRQFRRAHDRKGDRLRAISVVLPGTTDSRLRNVLWSRQMGWQQFPVADRLEALLGLPVMVTNNTRAMSFAEFRQLQLHEDQPMLFLQARFGLGASMVNSASPGRDAHYGVSELANIPLGANAFADRVPTDARLINVLSEKYLQAVLRACPGDGPVVPLLEQRCEAGDEVARRLHAQTIDNLARGLAIAVDLLHPSVIVLGGIYAQASPQFVEAVVARLRTHAQPELTEHLTVQCSRLGAMGAVQGGALVAFDRLLLQPNAYQ